MTKVSFKNVIDAAKRDNIRIEFDGDNEDKRLHLESMIRWGAKNKTLYNEATNEIDSIKYSGEGWEIYAWYDVSGFRYWMKDQLEQNYIQITALFESDTINESEVSKICAALENAQDTAFDIAHKYDFIPTYSN